MVLSAAEHDGPHSICPLDRRCRQQSRMAEPPELVGESADQVVGGGRTEPIKPVGDLRIRGDRPGCPPSGPCDKPRIRLGVGRCVNCAVRGVWISEHRIGEDRINGVAQINERGVRPPAEPLGWANEHGAHARIGEDLLFAIPLVLLCLRCVHTSSLRDRWTRWNPHGPNDMKHDALAIPLADAADLISISRSKAYAMAAAGDLPTIRIGRKTLVPMEALRQWLAERAKPSAVETTDAANAEGRLR